MSASEWSAACPLVYLSLALAATLLFAVARPFGTTPLSSHNHLLLMGLVGIAAAGASLVAQGHGASALSGALVLDGQSVVWGLIMLVSVALSMILMAGYITDHALPAGETYALHLLCALGMLIIALAGDLTMLFIGIELMSLSAYALVGLHRTQKRSQEAALKYFLYGAFASAFLVFGQAHLFGEVGRIAGTPSLRLSDLAQAAGRAPLSLIGSLGLAMFLAGLLFKVSAAPFHLWAPDAYAGAPAPVTGLMAVGVKTAGLLALCKVARATLAPLGAGEQASETFLQMFEVLACISMVLGNVVALRQTELKRLFAYSGIAHIGYLLLGVLALVRDPKSDVMAVMALYLSGYAAATLGALAIIGAFERGGDPRTQLTSDKLRGLGREHPRLALALSIFLLALAGIPPLSGFFGKFALFAAALQAARLESVVLAVLMSCVGAGYYLHLIVQLYAPSAHSQTAEHPLRDTRLTWGIAACVLVTFWLGVFPESYLGIARVAIWALEVP